MIPTLDEAKVRGWSIPQKAVAEKEYGPNIIRGEDDVFSSRGIIVCHRTVSRLIFATRTSWGLSMDGEKPDERSAVGGPGHGAGNEYVGSHYERRIP
jgi:hypothetical protein